MEKITKILIADDHTIFRQGLVKILEAEKFIKIVGECGDGLEAFQKIKELLPDIAILDISMPQLSGLEIVQKIRSENLWIEFIILTMYDDEEYFNEAMDYGVKGYLLKDNAASDLIGCIKSVASDKYYVSPLISEYLINRNSKIQEMKKKNPGLINLTVTEKRILKLIAENKTSREIAELMFISVRTVQNHRTNICNKLGFKGYNKLLQFSLENKSYL
ncbi:MAG: response regulator transcription factor [Calditrichaeota bacterium]|nr:response regulator transcription factor [Calditrichota bacterium]